MVSSDELRKKAEQFRKTAAIRTCGGQAADRRLIEMAYRLEEQADQFDRRRAELAALIPKAG